MFNLEDQVRDLRRELDELRSQLGRLPTRPASAPLRASIIRAQVKGAASSATFPVDNVVLITGVDPRDDPTSTTEEVTIANPIGRSFEDNEVIYCAYNEDEAQWEPFSAEQGPPGGSAIAGCGITVVGDTVSVNRAALTGPGLENDLTSTCGIRVATGCGLQTPLSGDDAGKVRVIPADFAGLGLKGVGSGGVEEYACPSMEVFAGCHLTFDTDDSLMVDIDSLIDNPQPGLKVVAGDTLLGTCDTLAVNHNCSLEIPSAGVDAEKLRVNHDFPLAANSALEWVDQETHCQIKVKHNCSLVIEDGELAVAAAMAGDFLNHNIEDCRFDVQNVLTSWVTEITGFQIVGNTIRLSYNRAFGRVLQVDSQFNQQWSIPLTECPP